MAEAGGADDPGGTANPFVGRQAELARIDAARTALEQGAGRLVLVTGTAGAGRTRLCAEADERARRDGFRALTARCWLDGGAPPLWPWPAILTALGGADAAGVLDGQSPVDTTADRFARFVAATEVLAESSSRGPLLLVIDDIHGADLGALLLTRFVVQSLPHVPLALVLTWRSDEPPGEATRAQVLEGLEAEADTIVLGGLDLSETTELVARSGLAQPGPTAASTLLQVTGGNPLFLRQIMLTAEARWQDGDLPPATQTAFEWAADRLEPRARHVLSVAAVLGPAPAVAEVATVARCDNRDVLDAASQGVAVGLVTTTREVPERVRFSNDVARTVLEETLRPADRLDAHARAAALLAPPSGDVVSLSHERLARAAHHAAVAALRSPDDACRAVTVCHAAAAAMVRNYAYERADDLLSTAVELHEGSPPVDDPGLRPTQLLLDWADAAVLCGRLDAARDRYWAAVATAQHEDDPALLAEAALCVDGPWLHQYHPVGDQHRIVELQRRASAEVEARPGDHAALLARLRTHLAAHAVDEGEPMVVMEAAVAAARLLGEPMALSDALIMSHHVLRAPDDAAARLALLDELAGVTATSDPWWWSLLARLWQAIDLVDLGEVRALRVLEDVRRQATTFGNRYVLHSIAVVDVMLLIREGRFVDAEAQAWACYERGDELGQVWARSHLYGQLAAIFTLQGRDEEVVDVLDAVPVDPAVSGVELAFNATAAAIAARTGRDEQARALLSRAVPDRRPSPLRLVAPRSRGRGRSRRNRWRSGPRS